MLLLLSSAQRLEARYGASGAASIRRAIIKLEDKLARRHGAARTIYPDDPESMDILGLEPMEMGSGSAVRLAILEILSRLDQAAEAVMIVGGDGVVPFYRLPNPVRNRELDADTEVMTDAPFATPERDPARQAVPADAGETGLAVGRVPDFEPPDRDAFLALLKSVRKSPRDGRRGVYAVVNQAWETFSRQVLAGRSPTLRTTPGWSSRDPEWRSQNARLLYFNLHGFTEQPAWRGFDNRSGRWLDAVKPAEVTPEVARGAVIFAENCYGALVAGRSARTSMALAFLRAGARAFVGATGLAFGSYLDAWSRDLLRHADLLARGFVARAAAGEPLGHALRRARAEYLRQSHRDGLNGYERKTAQQFVLYGDPLTTLD